MARRPIKVLIVDDSALVREVLSRGLALDPDIEVVGAAPDPYTARDMIVRLRPDVLSLDVELPRMDGVEFLRRLMPQHPLPVVMVSSMTESGKEVTIRALEAGAVDFVSKPTSDMSSGLRQMLIELRTKIKIASTANVAHWKHSRRESRPAVPKGALLETTHKVVAIGASTGGTEALREVLAPLPAQTPGVVVVQHMPPDFTRMFAERLNRVCLMEVREASDGDRVVPGRILIAPGDRHMRVRRSGSVYLVQLSDEPSVCGHKPSVDVLFRSVAATAGGNAVGVMLTGMGADGADAMLAMREAGARTMAQDEATSVVYGMPREAFLRGGAQRQVSLGDIAGRILSALVDEEGR